MAEGIENRIGPHLHMKDGLGKLDDAGGGRLIGFRAVGRVGGAATSLTGHGELLEEKRKRPKPQESREVGFAKLYSEELVAATIVVALMVGAGRRCPGGRGTYSWLACRG